MKFLVFSPEAFVPFHSLDNFSAFSRTTELRPRRGGCTDTVVYERLHMALVVMREENMGDERSVLVTSENRLPVTRPLIPCHATVQLLPNHQRSAPAISKPTTPTESSHTSSCKPDTTAITTRGSGRRPECLEPGWLQCTLSVPPTTDASTTDASTIQHCYPSNPIVIRRS